MERSFVVGNMRLKRSVLSRCEFDLSSPPFSKADAPLIVSLLTTGSFASLMSLLLQYLYALYYNPDDYNFHPHTMEQTQARQNLQGNLENAGVM